MNGKKTIPLLVIATLMLSLLPSVMFARALSIPDLTDLDGFPVTSGVKGDTVVVTGTDGEIPAGTTVQLYWDDATIAWNGVKGLLNSTQAEASGNYEVWFDVPEGVYGTHYLWVKTTLGGIADVASIAFTVNAYLKLSPSSGLAGDTITATMYGFPKSADITIDFDILKDGIATPTANSIGTATASFKVPTTAISTPPTTYSVTAHNVTWPGLVLVDASVDFVAGPVITLSATAGTVGQVITITGRGFKPTFTVVQGDVSLSGVVCYTTTDDITVDATGRIRLNVVVPQMTDKDDYVFTLASTAGNAEADFEVTALAAASVTPSFGPVASSMTVSGVNYPKISGITVTVELWDTLDTAKVADIGTVKTLSDGTISKIFKVPAAAEGGYHILAYNTDYNIADTVSFKVGSMNVILSEDSGPTGMTVTISGNGFTHSGTWNATFGTEEIIPSGTGVDGSGLLQDGIFQVPQLPVGTYTVTLWDIDAEISITTQFQITKTTSVTLSVPSAPNGFNVTLRGYGFSDDNENEVVDFVIYNTTSTNALDFWWTINVVNLPDASLGDCVTNGTGEFYGYWMVDDSDILSKGNYKINATDASGNYMVTIPFTVGDVHILGTPRKDTFKVGETISFNLEHSFGNEDPIDNSVLKIYDPSGTLVFSGDELVTWTKTGLWYTAPYSSQTAGGNPMVIAEDAPLGTWSWKWIEDAGDGDTIKSGTFAVVASDTSQLEAQVTALGQQVTALTTQLSTLSTTVGQVATTANAASAAATAASQAATAAATAATAASAAATAAGGKADSATAAANAAATAAQGAQTAANNLTTLVYAAIGASLVAALAAIVALMQISRKIA
jgi:hypothetical protein